MEMTRMGFVIKEIQNSFILGERIEDGLWSLERLACGYIFFEI